MDTLNAGDDVISLEKTRPAAAIDLYLKGTSLNSGMFCFRPVFCLKNQGHPEGI
jgi:hypothetical protein